MLDLSPLQMKILERLFEAGFRPIAIPPYENALCVHRGDCAAVLAPVPGGGLRLLAPVSYLIAGNFSVKLKKGGAEVFAWKKTEVAASKERLEELELFDRELKQILEFAATQ
jgi:hypothetical protein